MLREALRIRRPGPEAMGQAVQAAQGRSEQDGEGP
mgnify:CR=1 FL=1